MINNDIRIPMGIYASVRCTKQHYKYLMRRLLISSIAIVISFGNVASTKLNFEKRVYIRMPLACAAGICHKIEITSEEANEISACDTEK